ncbi:MAG: hypothetical protein RMJ48_15465 [Roseiflexaceae bacterium]|nr:hypothetical protein [Roseiflexaceae bacterium]
MIRLTQRLINHGVFGLIFAISMLALVLTLIPEPRWSSFLPTAVSVVVTGMLWLAYWRGCGRSRGVSLLPLPPLSVTLTPASPDDVVPSVEIRRRLGC